MKRFAALLTAFLFLLSASALALDGTDYPAWDGATLPYNGFCGSFSGENLSLTFDPSSDYSNVMDGIVQVCFFAYDTRDTNFLELYLLIPEDVKSGDVLQSGDGSDCSVYFYETTESGESFYYAGDLGNRYASDGSSFVLTIDVAEAAGSTLYMSGSLTAQMACYDREEALPNETLTISEAYFNFTLPIGGSPFVPAPTQGPSATFPSLPDSSTAPETQHSGSAAPAFTLPPNYVSL